MPGRLSHTRFWSLAPWFAAIGIFAPYLLSPLSMMLFAPLMIGHHPSGARGPSTIVPLIAVAFVVRAATWIPLLLLASRRLHDVGRSGAILVGLFATVATVPLFGFAAYMSIPFMLGGREVGVVVVAAAAILFIADAIAALILVVQSVRLCTRPGEPGTNRYGPVPA
ncbi:MAG: DUF805 domain-containing protein [Rhizomicrobium sp.]